MSKRVIRNLVVCVGAGGVFYHGLTMMGNFLKRREDVGVVLIDGDMVEKKNELRQWGFGVGKSKAVLGEKLVRELTGGSVGVAAVQQFVKEEGDLLKYVAEGLDYIRRVDMVSAVELEKVFVVYAPDNHLCRVVVHRECGKLAEVLKAELVDVTGGNTLHDGYAYGCAWDEDGVVRGDWLVRHDDVLESALAEERLKERPMPCGQLAEVAEQDVGGNSLTANCIWVLAEKMAGLDYTGELRWGKDEKGIIRIIERETNIVERIDDDSKSDSAE